VSVYLNQSYALTFYNLPRCYGRMSWSSFVRSVLSTAAGTAAGAATLPAGGPIAAAVANKAASTAAEAVMDQFMEAETSILTRIDEMNREMTGRLIDLQAGVDALLDKDHRAALLHLEEAARVPERALDELQAARSKLFDAWGAANTPMRGYLVAQHLVLVYALLNDPDAVRRWLLSSLEQIRAEIPGQVRRLHAAVVPHLVNPSRSSGSLPEAVLYFAVEVYGFPMNARRISRSEARKVVTNLFTGSAPDYGVVPEPIRWEGFIPKNDDLEGWLSGLAELDAESAAVRRLCEVAGVPYDSMPPYRWQDGAVRVYKGMTWYRYEAAAVLVRFSPFVAVEFATSRQDSPMSRPLPAELRQARNWQRRDEPAEKETFDYASSVCVWNMGRFVKNEKIAHSEPVYFG